MAQKQTHQKTANFGVFLGLKIKRFQKRAGKGENHGECAAHGVEPNANGIDPVTRNQKQPKKAKPEQAREKVG